MSSAPKLQGLSFKSFAKPVKKEPDVAPSKQLLATDLTASVPVPFKGEPATLPTMFSFTRKNRPVPELKAKTPAPAPAPAPTIRPVIRLTRKIQKPKGATEATEGLLPEIKLPSELAGPPDMVDLQKQIQESIQKSAYVEENPGPYVNEDSKGFTKFVATRFSSFALPPILDTKINPNACSEMKLQTYKYQAFIREYMRQASPYRGVLVYHGLGSGKTCTSIAAAEALYGQSNKKIIVMTPIALKENFLNEIMFCGFRHYKLKNTWVSFNLTDPSVRLFAKNVIGISEILLNRILKRSPEERVVWMPDLSKPEEESNFDELYPWERSAIREQLYDVLQNKITFIGYTGYTIDKLLNIASKNKTFFDDAVIVIDEVHNLTRLMAKKLDKYFTQPKRIEQKDKLQATTKKPKINYYEPVGVDRWEPDLITPNKYSRALLFYRLLSEAKNSKIIALSGTPIVNEPTEIGILSNILHGYFYCCEDLVRTTDDRVIDRLNTLVKSHPRINYYSVNKSDGFSTLFFTILDEGYVKTENQEGIEYVGIEKATPSTIKDLYEDIKTILAKNSIVLENNPKFSALPLLPPVSDDFKDTFIDVDNLQVKNRIVFSKRMSGLISYYRGSKEELMPMVESDEIVECPMSALAIPQYEEVRLDEISKTKKKKKVGQEAFDMDDSEVSSYRFKSRSICNFAFPTDIVRPFPSKKSDFKDSVGVSTTLLGDTPTDLGEDAQSVLEAEQAEKVAREQDVEEEAEGEGEAEAEAEGTKAKTEKISYQKRVQMALSTLNERKTQIFKMDPNAPQDQQLKTYSSKFAAILENIMKTPGSSLVYSTFKTIEGIGVFSMALDANGFAPIKLTGPETDLAFAPETIQSLLKNPEQPRYIIYSGDDTPRERQTLINIFNYAKSKQKLPTKIAQVLEQSPVSATGNLHGEICKVFMITGAGAEGLSLRNVRAVHIMEPYWNNVRTDQVKGRAIRICSHSDLPYSENPEENERKVKIYTYVTIFDKSLPISQTIQINDDSLTSDQYIVNLANAKEKVNSDIINLMKAGAIDCRLNKSENEKSIKCIVYEGPPSEFLYDPRLREDIEMTSVQVKTEPRQKAEAQAQAQAQPRAGKMIEVRGKKYKLIQDKNSDKLFLYDENDTLLQKPLGTYIEDPVTKQLKRVIG